MTKIICNKCNKSDDIVKYALINVNTDKIYKDSLHSVHCFNCDNNGLMQPFNKTDLKNHIGY